jgi:hypothetical protein
MQFRSNRWLIPVTLGNILTFLLVTLIGFASHGTLETAGNRMFTTFVSLLLSWMLIAPHLKVYDYQVVINYRQLWRLLWAMVLAAPMAAWLRGLILSSSILPLFVIILGGISAIEILIWRGLHWLVMRRLVRCDG